MDARGRAIFGREHERAELRRLDHNVVSDLDYKGTFLLVLLPDLAIIELHDELSIGPRRDLRDRRTQLFDHRSDLFLGLLTLASELSRHPEFVVGRRRRRWWCRCNKLRRR